FSREIEEAIVIALGASAGDHISAFCPNRHARQSPMAAHFLYTPRVHHSARRSASWQSLAAINLARNCARQRGLMPHFLTNGEKAAGLLSRLWNLRRRQFPTFPSARALFPAQFLSQASDKCLGFPQLRCVQALCELVVN